MGGAECERQLVLAAQAGDDRAFDRLIRRYRQPMLYVAGANGSQDQAEDVVQDAALTAYRVIRQLEDPDRFGPWLMAIVRNRARRVAVAGKKVEAIPLHLLDQEPSRRFEALLHTSSLQHNILHEAVKRLPEDLQQCVVLVYLDGWKVGQVAAFLELPVTTVKWRLHAGRAALKRWLGPSFEMQP